MYKLRPYQENAVNAAMKAFHDKENGGIIIIPTGGGKSWVIAEIARRLNAPVLILCPSLEILNQNYDKFCLVGSEITAGKYSASAGARDICKVTFATIGSIYKKPEDFKDVKFIISDECHLNDAIEGMYHQLFEALGAIVIGLTATPYRLYSQLYILNKETGKKRKNFMKVDREKLKEGETYLGESQLKFLTNIKGGNFKKVIYCIQTKELMAQGFLAKTCYYELIPEKMRTMKMYKNSSGSDFSDSSMKFVYDACDMHRWTINVVTRLLSPLNRVPRKGIIVFNKFVQESMDLAKHFGDIAGVVHGKMNKKEREQILEDFRTGKKKIIFNANCLVVGFDYPELDTIVLARPTLSLSVYYQAVGRVLRPHPSKSESWVIDLCGNFKRFGRVENLEVVKDKKDFWSVRSFGKQLTDVIIN